jgi:ABC-type Fe3+/spermidine/putrescine transport system ATPase subunit
MNWLNGRVRAVTEHGLEIETDAATFQAGRPEGLDGTRPVMVGFRPEAVRFGPHPSNSFESRIERMTYLGDVQQYELRLTPELLIKAVEQNPLDARRPEEAILVHVAQEDLVVLSASEPQEDKENSRKAGGMGRLASSE